MENTDINISDVENVDIDRILALNYSQKIAIVVGLFDLAFFLTLSVAIVIKSPYYSYFLAVI